MCGPQEEAIDAVKCYIKHISDVLYMYGYDLEQTSYSKWAACEILERLRNDDQIPPLLVIENFKNQMKNYMDINIKTSYIFAVVYDTAEDIIDYLFS